MVCHTPGKGDAGSGTRGQEQVRGSYAIRPENLKEDRVDRRLSEHQTGKRRVVIAFRKRGGRTLPFVTRYESEGVELAIQHVDRMAEIHADEASHWDHLHDGWITHRINHSEAYSDNGICTNQVESYFSRLRRMIRGQHHHVSPRYLYQYANEAAWKEDYRRLSNGEIFKRILGLGLAAPVSRNWKGYWQRRSQS